MGLGQSSWSSSADVERTTKSRWVSGSLSLAAVVTKGCSVFCQFCPGVNTRAKDQADSCAASSRKTWHTWFDRRGWYGFWMFEAWAKTLARERTDFEEQTEADSFCSSFAGDQNTAAETTWSRLFALRRRNMVNFNNRAEWFGDAQRTLVECENNEHLPTRKHGSPLPPKGSSLCKRKGSPFCCIFPAAFDKGDGIPESQGSYEHMEQPTAAWKMTVRVSKDGWKSRDENRL